MLCHGLSWTETKENSHPKGHWLCRNNTQSSRKVPSLCCDTATGGGDLGGGGGLKEHGGGGGGGDGKV